MATSREQSTTTHVSATQYTDVASSQGSNFSLLGSQYAPVVMNAVKRNLRDQQLSHRPTAIARLPDKPVLQTLPSSIQQASRLDPKDPLSDPWRRTLWHAFQNYGRAGIAQEMYKKAESSAGTVHWNKVLSDRQTGTFSIDMLLGGLTDACIRSMIRGTLRFDVLQDANLARFVHRHMKASKEAPSIYYMAPASATGKWLTPNQAEEMYHICQQYLTRVPTAKKMNTAIDTWPKPSGSDDQRILTNQHNKDTTQFWLAAMRKYYFHNVDTTKKDEPWVKVPSEVGFAVNTKDRLAQHCLNRKTTASFAIAQAVLRLPQNAANGIPGFGFPAVKQHELFPLFEDDETYAQLGEIVGSLLASSYGTYGGLNPSDAGTASLSAAMVKRPQSVFDGQMISQANRIRKSMFPDIETDRFCDLQRSLASLRALPNLQKESERKERECKERENKARASLEKLRKQWNTLGSLKKQSAEIMRKQQEEAIGDLATVCQKKQKSDEAKLVKELMEKEPS
ncbi:MAG: hypothetical protein Q9180_006747, partial [Flavoplaca navasiana]